MDNFAVEAETALAEMETALFEARPDAPRRLQPGLVGDAVRSADAQLDRLQIPHDHALFEMVARRWEKGYPADIEYEADLRDLKDEAISTREEIQALRRDVLRQERGFAAMQLDMDRVKTRLDLQDNPPS